jgi:peptidoglycan-associated lipoprotein
MRSKSIAFSLALSLSGMAGCSHEPSPQTAADVQLDGVTQTTSAVVAQPLQPADQTLHVSTDLQNACGIHDVSNAPKFAVNQSSLSPSDQSVLGQVATCLITGPLKGHDLTLVGRADARGKLEHNMDLGERRAMSVKAYLGQLGVPEMRLHETSRGALDAIGHDEASWRVDRRVDIDLSR